MIIRLLLIHFTELLIHFTGQTLFRFYPIKWDNRSFFYEVHYLIFKRYHQNVVLHENEKFLSESDSIGCAEVTVEQKQEDDFVLF